MDKKANIAHLLSVLDEMSPGGFAIALHIRSAAPAFLFQTFPIKWVDYYSQHGLVLKDPAMRWAFDHSGTIRWRDLTDDDPYGVMQQAKRHGLSYGFTHSIRVEKSRSVSGFARGDRDYLDIEIDEIGKKLHELHAATDQLTALSEADADALKQMSIRMTHT